MANIRIAELLRGCSPGPIQTVGFMQVIPLISEVTFDKYVAPRAVQVNNPSYAQLEFNNTASEQSMIVPSQMALLSKQAAQDHGMTTAAFIKAKSREVVTTAVCIQQSQPGNIRASEDNKLIVLPASIREEAWKQRKAGGQLGRLWPAITQFLQEAGVRSSQGNVIAFLDHYQAQLDQFIAEFEPVDGQVGAIVLVNGQVVGIERAPNQRYWSDVWSMLIRECYGSLAIIEAKKAGGEPKPPRTRVQIRATKGRTFKEKIADLKDAVAEAQRTEYERVKSLVNGLSEIDLPVTVEGRVASGQRIEDVGSDGQNRFVGQMLRENESVVYASLVSTKHYKDNEDWLTAKPFKM